MYEATKTQLLRRKQAASRKSRRTTGRASETDQQSPRLHILIESAHSGETVEITAMPAATVGWLTEQARRGSRLKKEVDVGALERFRVNWVLVDKKAIPRWEALSPSQHGKIKAVVQPDDRCVFSYTHDDILEQLDIYAGIIFHLYGLPGTPLIHQTDIKKLNANDSSNPADPDRR